MFKYGLVHREIKATRECFGAMPFIFLPLMTLIQMEDGGRWGVMERESNRKMIATTGGFVFGTALLCRAPVFSSFSDLFLQMRMKKESESASEVSQKQDW